MTARKRCKSGSSVYKMIYEKIHIKNATFNGKVCGRSCPPLQLGDSVAMTPDPWQEIYKVIDKYQNG